MSRPLTQLLPITHWPNAELNPPPTLRAFEVQIVKDWIVQIPPFREEPLKHEFVLHELLTANLDDPTDLATLISDAGVLRPTDLNYLNDRVDLVGVRWDDRRQRRNDFTRLCDGEDDGPFGMIHVDDARLLLHTARALMRHWMLHLKGENPLSAWDAEGISDGFWRTGPTAEMIAAESRERAEPGWETIRLRAPDHPLDEVDASRAWKWFVDALNSGLSPFHVRVEIPISLGTFGTATAGLPSPSLYSSLLLQLWNMIVEDLPMRICENEPCGQPFTRQAGVPGSSKRRTIGIKYCSKSCSRAQASRISRRKQKGKKA